MSLKPVVRVRQLGRLAFAEAYGIQTRTAEALRREILAKPAVLRRNTLLLVEHEPVFTVGIRSKGYTSEDESRLRKLGADFVRTNRGGLITFHGPGQLVAYPILYLGSFNEQKSMRWYVCQLEKTVVDTCAHFGLRADTTQETGVWIGDNKIAAIGVHGSRYVTTHGVALNCSTDLDWFSHIVPCGLQGKGVTSLSRELGRELGVAEASPVFLDSFRRHFNCQTVPDCPPSPL
uniref:Octanoyl-[acyl-carrier-protein]:protein N-octanoyltransferase LIPT2, mitochondrial n=1 Tax=Ixodes ricinus TaxID=34613 RepID=V5HSE1_IXORI